jgi:PKD repeat protein
MGNVCRLLTLVFAVLAAGCTVSDSTPPPLQGPSELGLSITLFANPDVLSQDGASQAQIVIEARDASGQLAPNTPVRVEIVYQGTVVDFGTLSTRTVVTGSNGRATVTYTAPPTIEGEAPGRVNIRVTPTGSNAANAMGRVVEIRLVPPGQILGGGPTPSFTVSPETPTAFQEVAFRSTSTAAPGSGLTSWAWNFGDGSTASGREVDHRFEEGTHLVRLTVTDTNGISASTSRSVTVGSGPTPTASFTFSPTSGNQPNQPVFFNGSGSTAGGGRRLVDFDWDFGDGQTAGGAVTSHTYAQPGSYTVTLEVTDDVGQTAIATRTVSVDAPTPPTPPAPPVASFTFSPATPDVSAGTNRVNFDAATSSSPSGVAITNYRWNFGDGFIISGAPGAATSPPDGGTFLSPQHTYVAPGSYNVNLIVTDANGRTGSVTLTVTVVP